MCKVKQFMYISDPRHPNHKEFLRLTREGPNRKQGKKAHLNRPKSPKGRFASYNPFTKDKPKYSYVLGSPVRSI